MKPRKDMEREDGPSDPRLNQLATSRQHSIKIYIYIYIFSINKLLKTLENQKVTISAIPAINTTSIGRDFQDLTLIHQTSMKVFGAWSPCCRRINQGPGCRDQIRHISHLESGHWRWWRMRLLQSYDTPGYCADWRCLGRWRVASAAR